MVVGLSSVALAADRVDFSRDVQPILSDNCFKCHGPDEASRKGDLRLDTLDPKEGPLAARDGYFIVKPGSLDDSVLVMRITSDDDDTQMPPPKSNRHLTPQQVDILKRWVEQGAKWGKHWSFVSPVRVEPPKVSDERWVKNPIDRFVLARLDREHITPSPPAEKATLLRRVALDLTGLPPTPAEIDAFVADASPDAYEKHVDHLLASPHFGERQARHWLDNARYADSNGYSQDLPRTIWPYRDWVINALNADMPFDQFTIEQLAGDLLPNATISQRIATGFNRNTQWNTEGGIDPEQFRVESIVDRVATTSTVFLGLTMACAQCHDHKFDPLPQKDYYRFFAFFNNCDEPTLDIPGSGVTDPAQVEAAQAEVAKLQADLDQRFASWKAGLSAEQLAKLPTLVQEAIALAPDQRTPRHRNLISRTMRAADNDYGGIEDRLQSLHKQLSSGVTTLVLQERLKEPRETHLLIKGDFTRPSDVVTAGLPEVLSSGATDNLNRLDLAKWIVSADNPLTARVIVNRIWMQCFGRGLVETENDFGTQGSPPTHPELLDYLATEFVSHGWSQKYIYRLIATSNTYRQSSNVRPELADLDPYNKLLARQSRVRLDAEIVRDVALEASGLLSEKVGGPSVFPPVPDGVMGIGQIKHEWRTSKGADRYRRGMYTFTFRNSMHPSLSTFDAPDAILACTRRIRSNTPLQALNLLNDTAWVEFSRALAARTLKEVPSQDDRSRLTYAFRLVTSRTPTGDEIQILSALLDKKRADLASDAKDVDSIIANAAPKGVAKPEYAAWTLVARTILNLDESITRE